MFLAALVPIINEKIGTLGFVGLLDGICRFGCSRVLCLLGPFSLFNCKFTENKKFRTRRSFFDVLVVLLSDFLVLWMVGCGFHLESLFFSCIFFLGKIQGLLFLFLFSV